MHYQIVSITALATPGLLEYISVNPHLGKCSDFFYVHGQESPGWISLYKLITFFVVVENIQKHHFFLKKLIGQ